MFAHTDRWDRLTAVGAEFLFEYANALDLD